MSKYNIDIDIDKMFGRFYHAQKNPRFGLALERGLEEGYNELALKMIDKVLENLKLFGLGDSKLDKQIDIDITDDGVSMRLTGGYAIFVEYGTGVVGEQMQHPMPSRDGWEYDVNEHGDEGWWYPSTESDPNPTRYLTKSGQWLAWTAGMPSRPFMYLTWLWASRSATQIIDKHINREFKKVEREMRL